MGDERRHLALHIVTNEPSDVLSNKSAIVLTCRMGRGAFVPRPHAQKVK